MRFVVAISAALLLCTKTVIAQSPTAVLGERVRVHTSDGTAVVGSLSRLDADTLVVTVVRKHEPSEVAVPRGYVYKVERSIGRTPDFMRGLGLAATGTVLTLGFGLVYRELMAQDGWEVSGPNVAFYVGTWVAAGLVTAFLQKKDRWEPVQALPPVTPVVGAADGRARLGLRVGF